MEGQIFTYPLPIWEDPEPCPSCGSDQVFKLQSCRPPEMGSCLDCGWWWEITDENEQQEE